MKRNIRRRKRRHEKRNLIYQVKRKVKKLLIHLLLVFSICFIGVITNTPPSAQSKPASTELKASSLSGDIEVKPTPSNQVDDYCPVIFHRVVGGVYGLEIQSPDKSPAYWLLVDKKSQVKQIKKAGISIIPYDKMIQRISPESVGSLSRVVFEAYGNTSKVWFFRGSAVDVSRSVKSTCLENLMIGKRGLKIQD